MNKKHILIISFAFLFVLGATMVLASHGTNRLPIENQDNGQWGHVLNTYLAAGHDSTGLNNAYAASSITAAAINATSINTTHIVDGTLLAADLAASSINTTHIVDGTLLAADLAASSINTTHIVDGTLLAADLAAGSVNASHLTSTLDFGAAGVNLTILNGSTAGLRIGPATTGNMTNPIIGYLYGVASLDFPSQGAAACTELNMSVPGAVAGDVVMLGLPPSLVNGVANATYDAHVVLAGIVSVRRCNPSSGANIDPAAATVKVGVWRHLY